MMLLCFLAVYLFFLYVPLKQAMHMFQQNRYNRGRYQAWMRSYIRISWKTMTAIFLTLLLSYGLFFLQPTSMREVLLLMLVTIFAYISSKLEEERSYRKPFVKTARIHRLTVFLYAFYTVILCMLHTLCSPAVWILVTPFLYGSPWLVILLCAWILSPLETAIRNHYASDAQRLLQEHGDLSIIGITGSYGKTSVKTILNELLSGVYYTLMTPGSYNNQMGITLTIRTKLQHLHEVFLCEMGADHVREIHDLMQFVKPRYGVVTSVGPQHLATFGSMDNILHEKMQMIECLPPDGIGFVNRDNAYIQSYTIKNKCHIVWFGMHEAADYRCSNIRYSEEGTSFTVTAENQEHSFHTRLLGKHNVVNITCAIAVAHTLGISWEIMALAVEKLPYVEHRLQVRKSFCTLLDDAYNSNPEGARCALEVIKQMKHKRFIITPGFLELGEKQEEEQYTLGQEIADSVDVALLVGRIQTKSIVKGLQERQFPAQNIYICDSFQEALSIVQKQADSQDCVLLENDLPDAFNH